MLIDAGYGNNTTFLSELEKRKLKYLGGLAKNRKVIIESQANKREEIRLDDLAKSMPVEAFTPIQLNLDKPKTVWVATVEVELSRFEGTRTIAIVMNASSFQEASDLDYFITNVDGSTATAEWIVTTYSQRNWVEVFYVWHTLTGGLRRRWASKPLNTFVDACLGVSHSHVFSFCCVVEPQS